MMDGGLERLRGHDLLYKVLFQGTFPSNIRALTEVISLKRCSKLENRDLGVQKCLVILRGAFMLCVCGDIMYYYHIILGWEQQYI